MDDAERTYIEENELSHYEREEGCWHEGPSDSCRTCQDAEDNLIGEFQDHSESCNDPECAAKNHYFWRVTNED